MSRCTERLRPYLPPLVVLSLALSLSLIVVTLKARADQTERSNRVICGQIHLIKQQIRQTVNKSLETTPKISYYREHPVELQVALANARETLRTFRPRACP